jgi:hypothetical protein
LTKQNLETGKEPEGSLNIKNNWDLTPIKVDHAVLAFSIHTQSTTSPSG